jgi:hypothetical protein
LNEFEVGNEKEESEVFLVKGGKFLPAKKWENCKNAKFYTKIKKFLLQTKNEKICVKVLKKFIKNYDLNEIFKKKKLQKIYRTRKNLTNKQNPGYFKIFSFVKIGFMLTHKIV